MLCFQKSQIDMLSESDRKSSSKRMKAMMTNISFSVDVLRKVDITTTIHVALHQFYDKKIRCMTYLWGPRFTSKSRVIFASLLELHECVILLFSLCTCMNTLKKTFLAVDKSLHASYTILVPRLIVVCAKNRFHWLASITIATIHANLRKHYLTALKLLRLSSWFILHKGEISSMRQKLIHANLT